MSNKFLNSGAALLVVASLMGVNAHARNIVVGDGQNVHLAISHSFPTRLSFKNDVGKQFIFNTVDGESPVVSTTKGQSGDVFVSVTKGKVGDVLGGFITTSQGFTYPVDVAISDKRQEHLVIVNSDLEQKIVKAKEKRVEETKLAQAGVKGGKTEQLHPHFPDVDWSSHTGHYQASALLMKALYHRLGFKGFRSTSPANVKAKLDVKLSEKADFVLTGPVMQGVRMKVTNHSTEGVFLPDTLQGREDLVSASFSEEFVGPGESTTVYIIIRRG